MAKLTYSVAVKLLAEDFKKGIRTVRTGFSSLQANIVTLASAIGALDVSLSGFVSGVANVTRETQRASTVMRNVSATAAEYAENMRWAADTARHYGVYVNDLVTNFAKFRGAAAASNLTIDEQRELFDNVTRATTAFGLSADQTNGVFLALTQVIGKGKVQAEELRGQLAERMPIAMTAMAKAAGTTVAGLEDLMKQGRLTADILPEFGRALAEMTAGAQTDTLEASISRLRNAAQEFTDRLDLGGAMKQAADTATAAIQTAAANIGNIIVAVIAIIAGAVARGGTKVWTSVMATAKKIEATALSTEAKLQKATEARVAAQQKLEQTRIAMAAATGRRLVALQKQEAAEIRAVNNAMAAEQEALTRVQETRARAAAISTQTAWGRIRSAVVIGAAKIRAALSGMWASFGPAIIITAVTAIIGKFVSLRKEIEEINGRLSEFRKGIAEAGKGTPLEMEVRGYMEVAQSAGASETERVQAAAIAASRTGQQGQGAKESAADFIRRIADGVEAYFTNNAINAQREQAATAKAEQLTRLNEIRGSFGLSQLEGTEHFITLDDELKALRAAIARRGFSQSNSRRYTEAVQATRIIIEADEILQNSVGKDKETPAPASDGTTVTTDTGTGGGGDDGTQSVQTEAERLTAAYAKEVDAATALMTEGITSQTEYLKALDELRDRYLREAITSGDTGEAMQHFADTLRAQQDAYTPAMQAADEIAAAARDYAAATSEAANLREAGLMDDNEYYTALRDAAEAAARQVAAIDPTNTALKDYRKAIENATGKIRQDNTPTYAAGRDRRQRQWRPDDDPRLDYRDNMIGGVRSKALMSQLDEAEKYVNKMQDRYNKLKAEGAEVTDDLIKQIEKAQEKVTDLQDALAMEEAKKDLRRAFSSGMGFQDMVSGIDGVVSSIEQLNEVMNDSDATGWDKFKAGFNVFMSIVGAINSTIQAIQTMQTVIGAFQAFQRTQDALTTATEVTNSSVRTTASTTEMAADMAGTAAKTTKAYASIPFVGVALAAAAIAAMIGMIIASKRKAKSMATGGIVEGATATGDRVAANLNAGEMVLNRRQQRNLFALLDGQAAGAGQAAGGVPTVRLRGEDIYIAYNNYRRRTGKP